MSSISPTIWHHNRYSAEAECEHCGGIVRHEPWCITSNSVVYYAYQIVVDASALTLLDRLSLHSLGVTWDAPACSGGYKNC
jgi:hypothetical protein